MSSLDADAIYALLPATVRMRDSGALRDLIGVLATQAAVVDDNLAQLYDDLFIQTCVPWVIPYIGDLLGYRPIRPIPPNNSTARADVADTIGLRRRKGTVAVLDQLAVDVTGWPAVAVEFFQRLAVSQYVRNHLRPADACVDVHGWQSAADFNSAFDTMPRTADVRRIASGRGRHNIPNVGVFVWRLMALGGATLLTPVAPSAPIAMSFAGNVGANRYTFDPFGDDVPLVNPPQAAAAEFLLTERRNVPEPLRRFALYVELEKLRAVKAGTLDSYTAQFFGVPPAIVIWESDGTPIDPTKICACNLEDWTAPIDPAIRVAVDPELGRLTFNGAAPDPVRVACAYSFSGDYGGGTYQRPADPGEGAAQTVPAFAHADSTSWQSGVFEIADSGSFAGDLPLTPSGPLFVRAAADVRPIVLGQITIDATPGGTVTLRGIGVSGSIVIRKAPGGSSSSGSGGSSSSSASSGFSGTSADPSIFAASSASAGSSAVAASSISAVSSTSAISSTFAASGTSAASSASGASTGPLTSSTAGTSSSSGGSSSSGSDAFTAVALDSAFTLILEHCTVRGPLVWSFDEGGVLTITRSLCAALYIDDKVTISITDSSVDAGSSAATAIAAADGSSPCGEVDLSACTVIGTIAARETSLIENSLLCAPATFGRTQAGCVRYSYVPGGSSTPRRFRCQPDLAIDTALAAARGSGLPPSASAQQAIRDEVSARVSPTLVSTVPGECGYLQLSDRGPPEIALGAEGGDEMGIFHGLYNGRRESNLVYRLNEYLRIGLEAGVIHAS